MDHALLHAAGVIVLRISTPLHFILFSLLKRTKTPHFILRQLLLTPLLPLRAFSRPPIKLEMTSFLSPPPFFFGQRQFGRVAGRSVGPSAVLLCGQYGPEEIPPADPSPTLPTGRPVHCGVHMFSILQSQSWITLCRVPFLMFPRRDFRLLLPSCSLARNCPLGCAARTTRR